MYTERKTNRLRSYDYSSSGAYFVTVCTQNRARDLSVIAVGDGSPVPKLTEKGKIVEQYILQIPQKYQGISVDKYIIMPAHIHLIISIGTGNPSPTVDNIMGWFKYVSTKQINSSCSSKSRFWQRSYFDHVIRNQTDYNDVWEYIDNNCLKWIEKEKCKWLQEREKPRSSRRHP